MALKALILALFIAILISLFSGLWFLLRDPGRSRRTLRALAVRVALSALLIALLAWGFWSGQL